MKHKSSEINPARSPVARLHYEYALARENWIQANRDGRHVAKSVAASIINRRGRELWQAMQKAKGERQC